MIFIIGGACQGKKRYAEQRFGISPSGWTSGETCSCDDVLSATALCDLQSLLRHLLDEGSDVLTIAQEWIDKNPDLILTCDEVGCGIVPLAKQERIYRDTVGQVCCLLADASTEVHRVHCGIGQRIK